MPEDYQTILDDLGVDTSGDNNQDPANPDVGNATDPNTTNNQEPTATGDQNPEGDGQSPSGDNGANAGNNQPNVGNDAHKANEAFAALRAENAKYKKWIQGIMQGTGAKDEEEFMSGLTEAAVNRQAQQAQVSPEILKRLNSLEAQNRDLIESDNRKMFAANIKNLQEQFKLSQKDLEEFIGLAAREHIDLTVPGTNFTTLYQGLFFDKILTKKIEEERQNWIAQNSKGDNASNPDGKSGKKDPTPTNVNTMAEFDSLLQSIPKNKN